jgi:surface antigen
MDMRRTVFAGAAGLLLLVGCQDPNFSQYANKSTAGTLGGAALGGLAGSQIGGGSGKLIATGLGVLLGGFLGNQVGQSLDRADQSYASQAYERAGSTPINQTIRWNNPQNGHSGDITPVREGRSENGEYCREFRHSIVVDGRRQNAYGTACRQPDGTWRIVS